MIALDFRRVLDTFPDAVVACDGTGQLVYANAATERLLGWSSAELLGQPLTKLIPERLQPSHRAGFERYRMTREPRLMGRPIRLPARRKDGGEMDIELTLAAFHESNGEDLIVASLRDLRDRVELERQTEETQRRAFLAEASTRLAASLDYPTTIASVARFAVPWLSDWCAVHVLEPNGVIRNLAIAHADPARLQQAEELERRYPTDPNAPFGPAQVLRTGQPEIRADVPDELLQAYARDPDHLDLLRQLGLKSYMVVPLIARGRTLGTLALAVSTSNRHYGPDDLVLAQDLAQRAALAVDNARLYQEAQDAINARNQFISIASHELRTHLTPLHLQFQMLLRQERQGTLSQLAPARLRSMLLVCDRQTKQLTRLVADLLDVSHMSTGPLELRPTNTDLIPLVRDVVSGFGLEATQAGCVVTLQAEAAVVGCWDRARLEQVVTNLLSNAIKYGAGKPIEVVAAAEASSARLSIRDQGIGIPPDHRARIFERFERAVSDREYSGLGLGLYIVRQIVEAHGGQVRVDSEVGVGSTFTVELPCSQ